MTPAGTDTPLPAQLAAAWPVDRWRDLHVLAAVSGGADSMALLRALVAVKQSAGGRGRIFAGHVNHGLRGDAADADAHWLADQCQALDVPLHVEQVDARALAADQGDGLEAAARALRYERLTVLAERLGARFVAVAHTRDDQVETVLFRIVRGSGLRGLAGIPRSRPLSPSVALVRPLLDIPRAAVLDYLRAIDQPFRHDATNDSDEFARNRLRHELLPMLRRYNAEVDRAIARVARHASDAQAVVDGVAAELLAACRAAAPADGAALVLSVLPLRDQPEYLVAEVIRQAWRDASLPEQAMTRRWWRRLARFAQEPASPPMNLPANLRAQHRPPHLLSIVEVALRST